MHRQNEQTSPLDDFYDAVVEVRLLLSLASQAGATDHAAKTGNAILRAGVVLLVSHFESYLKSLARNFVDAVGAGELESRRIPIGIRELHTLPKMAEIVNSADPAQRAGLLKKMHAVVALWNDDAKPPKGTLNAATLRREVANADSKTIDALFELMGLQNPVCDGDLDLIDNYETKTFNIRLGLTDVVKCRNDIAHGDASRLPTAEDAERYVVFLTNLAERLSRKADALLEELV